MTRLATLLVAIGLLTATPALAQATVTDATAVATGRDRARVVATITVPQDDELVGASSPIAGMADIHAVARRGSSAVMIHHPIALKAGVPRRLSIHGDHIMLMSLTAPLPASFPLTLRFAHAAAVTLIVRSR